MGSTFTLTRQLQPKHPNPIDKYIMPAIYIYVYIYNTMSIPYAIVSSITDIIVTIPRFVLLT